MADNRILVFDNFSSFAAELKAKYARKSALEALQSKVEALEVVGGQANVLEGVKVNGTALSIANKMVDILVATGTNNGTISVNNAEVAVAGLQALAFKAQVSEADLDTALAAVIAAKASQSDLNAVSGKVTTLVGEDADKSARSIAAEEVAKIVAGADASYDTLKEIADWISSHSSDATSMNSQINTNKSDIATLTALIGELPEDATSTTVVEYIAEAIAALGIGDYAKAADLTAEVNRAKAAEAQALTDAKAYADGLASNYDAAGSATQALTDAKAYAKSYADGLASNYDAAGSANNALTAAKSYADSLASNYDASGAAANALTEAKSYTDTKVANYVLTSSVGVVTASEVTALLAD